MFKYAYNFYLYTVIVYLYNIIFKQIHRNFHILFFNCIRTSGPHQYSAQNKTFVEMF